MLALALRRSPSRRFPGARRLLSAAAAAEGAAGRPRGPAAGEPAVRVQYESHVPTTPTQKLLLSVASALGVFTNPERGDLLAALGEVTGRDALRAIHARMCADPVGARVLMEKPVIRSEQIDLQALRRLPEDSFGFAYAAFMDSHGFEPDGRSLVRFVDDPELAYVMQRHRELHDFWHTLFGLPPTVLGEIALKYVEMAQTRLPVAALSSLVGPLRLSSEERRLLVRVYIPWASRAGREAAFLLNVMYEEEFETPIAELRRRLNIRVAPELPDTSHHYYKAAAAAAASASSA